MRAQPMPAAGSQRLERSEQVKRCVKVSVELKGARKQTSYWRHEGREAIRQKVVEVVRGVRPVEEGMLEMPKRVLERVLRCVARQEE